MVTLALVGTMLFLHPASAQTEDRPGHVHTSREGTRLLPLPREKGVWHFVVFGDRTGGPVEGIEVLAQAVHDTNLLDPDLVMTVGDLIEGYNARPQWLQQMTEFHEVMDRLRMPWYPVAGNHDIYWRGSEPPPGEHEGDYEKHFGPLWYWFEHKKTAFVVLYSDEGDPETGTKGFSRAEHTQMSGQQMAWLRSVLEKTRELERVFVFLHHPRWITSTYPGSNWDEVHTILARPGNVRAVFAGHIHRLHYGGERDGIEYFSLATTGGVKSYELPEAGWLHHLNVVTVRKDSLQIATVPVGAVLDPRQMTPEHLDDVDLALEAPPPRPEAPVVIELDGNAAGQTALTLENPSQRPLEVTLTFEASPSWRLAPDHVHCRIEPGSREGLPFAYRREGKTLEDATLPTVVLATDYLGRHHRIRLPERRFPLRATLGEISPEVFTAAKPGHLYLDGKQSCLRVESDALPLPQGAFTVEGWVRAESYRGRRPFITKTEDSEYGIFLSAGIPSFFVHLDGHYVVAEAREVGLEAGRWHHVAGVFDGAEARLYVNGTLQARAPGKGTRTRNHHPFFVGADPDRRGQPTDFFRGVVDEVRISRGVRYTGDSFTPARRHAVDAETVLLLHLDTDLGPFTLDESPNRAHALRVGGARCTDDQTRGTSP